MSVCKLACAGFPNVCLQACWNQHPMMATAFTTARDACKGSEAARSPHGFINTVKQPEDSLLPVTGSS